MNDLLKVFNEGNARILKALSASDGMYLREMAEKTKTSPATAHVAMALFKKHGFVTERKDKNRIVYSLNRKNIILKKLMSLLNISELAQLSSLGELTKFGAVGIYGSFASGEDTHLSDIDLWICPKAKTDSVKLREISKKIGEHFKKEAKLLVLSDEKIKRLKENDPEFYYRLRLTSVIFGAENNDAEW